MTKMLIWTLNIHHKQTRVKSGNFGNAFTNSGNPDETALNEPSHQEFHCLLSHFIFYSNN